MSALKLLFLATTITGFVWGWTRNRLYENHKESEKS